MLFSVDFLTSTKQIILILIIIMHLIFFVRNLKIITNMCGQVSFKKCKLLLQVQIICYFTKSFVAQKSKQNYLKVFSRFKKGGKMGSRTDTLKTNILYYIEHTLSNYWFYDPVM